MSYSRGISDVVPSMVSPLTFGWSALAHERTAASTPSSSSYESNNYAAYYPILVPTLTVVRRLWWANGSSVSASYSVDVGIYADAGYLPASRLVSAGSTAQGTASQIQFVDVTDTVLPPGRYWLAIACNNASATFFRTQIGGGTAAWDTVLRYQQTSAFALPSSATPVESSGANVYLFGFATTASP